MEHMHAHIEVKKNGKWHHFAAPSIKPDYILYAIATGHEKEYLRYGDRIQPVSRIHNNPKDISDVTWDCLNHDMCSRGVTDINTLESNDIKTLQEKLYEYYSWIEPSDNSHLNLEHSIFHTYINGEKLHLHKGFDDVRIIIWYTPS